MRKFLGNVGIGYVCYVICGVVVFEEEVQFFYVNVFYGIIFVYNGNFINMYQFEQDLFKIDCCYINLISDMEMLVNVLVMEI